MRRVHTKTIKVEVSYVYYGPRHRRPLIQVSKRPLSMTKQECGFAKSLTILLNTLYPYDSMVQYFLHRNAPTLLKTRKGGKFYPIPKKTEGAP